MGNELSEQMQTALFNSNHITQPEYYAGLQNQQLILSHTMKQAQTEYQTLSYQYTYYQNIAIQSHQQQQQQQKNNKHQQQMALQQVIEEEQKQNAFNSLNPLTFDHQNTMNMMDGVNIINNKQQMTTKHNKTANHTKKLQIIHHLHLQ